MLIVGAQLVMLPFDPDDHVATSTAVTFQVGGVAYLMGFVALVLFVIAGHEWVEAEAGRLGAVATMAAAVGTMALGGDLWFETFAVPWLADRAPAALDSDPTILLAVGAISSYLLFALGWILYGVASLRGHVPVAVSVTLLIGGALGYRTLGAVGAFPSVLQWLRSASA